MQNRNWIQFLLVTIIGICLTGCATTHVPNDWLGNSEDLSQDSFGGWIDIECRINYYSGELIAVSPDTLFVADTAFHAVALSDILSARLITYHATNMTGTTLLGAGATCSNGLLAVITFPMWIIGGSIAGISRSYDPIIDYPESSINEFTPFARYPQGLPADIEREKIQSKRLWLY